ncbi:Endonuclease, Uma2 family (restriction endonuclease fold) [Amycolatopsis arida]|uniref:Endonuclease, Uma2 family (Restriction endonuclease fold) n=1 Tax=Amycolatopsis arida TaxID=587909 RepID=A0A1I5KX20_9PSEU|nr:Uma2 family endonuclease [Amycolatopsis arida]TDX85871.1 Uma2 family endonuclease [Amycolatopsis arida]SFO89680.1 Endonuclease, Uma2 family (restriction endonuclease fold) [Amycolatopsis arida]
MAFPGAYPDQRWLRLPAPPVALADFDAIEEDTRYRYEVEDGVLIVSPRPATLHQIALAKLIVQLDAQVPSGMTLAPEVEVLLAESPLRIRVPDLVVLRPSVDMSGPRQRAEDVLLVVEIVSPGSVRPDTRDKPDEYAEAGIPHYWLVDLNRPVSVTGYHLTGEFGYRESFEASGQVAVDSPFPVRLDLTRLPAR